MYGDMLLKNGRTDKTADICSVNTFKARLDMIWSHKTGTGN